MKSSSIAYSGAEDRSWMSVTHRGECPRGRRERASRAPVPKLALKLLTPLNSIEWPNEEKFSARLKKGGREHYNVL